VGSHLVDELLRRGTAVRALVRDPARADALRERGIEVIVGDVCEAATLDEAVKNIDIVYHCAAAVGHHSRQTIYQTNRDGVAHLLDAVKKAGAGRVVLLSSVNVLGTRNLNPATEDLPCRRSSDPAADVKIEAERLTLEYTQKHGLDATILRPGFIYGPGDTRNLPKLAAAVHRGKFAFIGSRDNVVPIVHVSDVVQSMLLAGDNPAARGRIYHVTDGSRTTIGELVDHLADLQGVPRPQKRLPFLVPWAACWLFDLLGWLRLFKGPGPINRPGLRFVGTSRFVDIGRARQELGYHPEVEFRYGIAATLRWIEEQQHEPIEFAHARA
jgi:nucleoside-diphosphate-sugar epimerase